MFLLLLRPSKIFIFFHSAKSSEWCLGSKRSPRRQRIRSSPPLYFRNSLGRCLADFANLSAHSPSTATAAGPQKIVLNWPPHPVHIITDIRGKGNCCFLKSTGTLSAPESIPSSSAEVKLKLQPCSNSDYQTRAEVWTKSGRKTPCRIALFFHNWFPDFRRDFLSYVSLSFLKIIWIIKCGILYSIP
jgi:hypothetical protein